MCVRAARSRPALPSHVRLVARSWPAVCTDPRSRWTRPDQIRVITHKKLARRLHGPEKPSRSKEFELKRCVRGQIFARRRRARLYMYIAARPARRGTVPDRDGGLRRRLRSADPRRRPGRGPAGARPGLWDRLPRTVKGREHEERSSYGHEMRLSCGHEERLSLVPACVGRRTACPAGRRLGRVQTQLSQEG